MNVLIVEDSELVLARLLVALKDIARLSIREVTTLEAARQAYAQQRPDFIILDLHLPDGNGITWLPTLRREVLRPTVAIFSNLEDYRDACLDAGADFFFDKAEEFEGLLRLVRLLAAGDAA